MAPIQTNQRTGRSLKWNRSLQLVDKPTTWTRDNLVFGDVARSVKHKRDGARRGPSDGVTGEGNIRRQSTEGSDIESDVGESSGDLVAGSDDELDDNVSETEDELDGSASDTDNESDGGISDAEDEDDGLDSGNDTLPPAPDTDAAPTLTLNPPGAGIRTVPVPTDTTIPPASATSEDIIVVSPTGSPDLSMITMTAIVPTTAESSSVPLTTLNNPPLAEVTNPPQKGVVKDEPLEPLPPVDSPLLPTLEITSSEPVLTTITTQTPLASKLPAELEFENDDGPDDDDWRGQMGPPPPPPTRGGLSQSAEHALIAVGSIGAFILFSFIAWMVYRTMKRYRGTGNDVSGRFDKFTTWKRKDSSDTSGAPEEPPPTYEKGARQSLQTQDYFATERLRRTGTSGSKGSLRKANLAGGFRPEPQMPESPAVDMPMGISIPDTPGNQPPVLPTPVSETSEAARRQLPTYRESQLSSLSSGFGDGDMMAPQPLTAPPPAAPGPAPVAPRQSYAAGGDGGGSGGIGGTRDSWMSRSGGTDSRRETVYTQTSEDRPVRFRSINSWVNQQTGRVQRANSRARERGEVPVMPAIPGQLNVTQQTAYR